MSSSHLQNDLPAHAATESSTTPARKRGKGNARGLDPNCLRSRILAYFSENPEEELTAQDIATKFEKSVSTVYTTMHQIRTAGLIESAHVWRLPAKGRA